MKLADSAAVRQRFEAALERVVEQLRADACVVGAVLLGSLSWDVVWERSDIDLLVVTQEVKRGSGGRALVEDDINVHAIVISRNELRKSLQSASQGSILHSALAHGRVLFTRDPTLDSLIEDRRHVGTRDQARELLATASCVFWALAKAQKWLWVKHDEDYCFFYITKLLDWMARIETLLHGEMTGREVLQQAMRWNPALFTHLYTDLFRGPRTYETLDAALETIDGYLAAHARRIFAPLFEYLAAAGGARTITDIDYHFGVHLGSEGLVLACEWLADHEMIRKLAVSVRLTEKSRTDVQEAAYEYEPEAAH